VYVDDPYEIEGREGPQLSLTPVRMSIISRSSALRGHAGAGLMMRAVDRLLRGWRMRMAAPHVRSGDRLLDIGCHDGRFIESVLARVSCATGIDPLARPVEGARMTIVRGVVPGDLRPDWSRFDCVTMLATLEHVDDPGAVARNCFRLLEPGGRLVLTVPHTIAHHIIQALVRVGLADGMGLEPAYGFDARTTEPLLARAGFRLVAKQPFELGLNCLYVFEKPRDPP